MESSASLGAIATARADQELGFKECTDRAGTAPKALEMLGAKGGRFGRSLAPMFAPPFENSIERSKAAVGIPATNTTGSGSDMPGWMG